jgi:colanic acid/amylovoran biosynthesis glycosyltransferase
VGARILPTARAPGLPLVVSFHGGDVTKARHWRPAWQTLDVQALRSRALAAQAAQFQTPSAYLRGRLIERGFPADRIVVHYHGVEAAAYQPLPWEARQPRVVFAGRFVEKKGLPVLIQAMRQVQLRRPDLALVVAGDGADRAAMQAMAAGLRVEFLGFLPLARLRQEVARSWIMAVPSVTAADGDTEGLPTVLYEAAALGVPVVATRHAGIPELVDEGQTGFLVAERDGAALANRLLTLADDADLRGRMGSAARRLIEARYDTRQRIRALEGFYDQALEQAGRAGQSRPA